MRPFIHTHGYLCNAEWNLRGASERDAMARVVVMRVSHTTIWTAKWSGDSRMYSRMAIDKRSCGVNRNI